MPWPPHITVATIIENDGKFLMVEETSNGKLVYNQPAGHLEPDETLKEAAIREVYEETGWHCELTDFISVTRYTSRHNDTIYYRHSFAGKATRHDPEATLDEGIEQAVWLSLDELKANPEKLRSPLVLKNIEQYLNGQLYPLSTIDDEE